MWIVTIGPPIHPPLHVGATVVARVAAYPCRIPGPQAASRDRPQVKVRHIGMVYALRSAPIVTPEGLMLAIRSTT